MRRENWHKAHFATARTLHGSRPRHRRRRGHGCLPREACRDRAAEAEGGGAASTAPETNGRDGVKEWALVTALAAAVLGFMSTLLMTRGTRAPDWSTQTWGGQSDIEKANRRITRRYFVAGLAALATAFALAALSAVLGYLV